MASVAKKTPKGKNVKTEYELEQEEKAATSWLDKEVTKAKDKPVSGLVELTPALARVLMQRNPNNRHISYPIVEKFARDIANGQWLLNGEPIIISSDGLLNDGQHRAEAVILADKPIQTILIVGVDRDTRTTLDQGRMRTIGDYLSMEGHSDSNNLGATASFAWQWKNFDSISTASNHKATKGELKAFVDANPRLIACVDAVPTKGSFSVGGKACLAFCRYAFSSLAPKQEADTFIYHLMSGENLQVGSPILYARTRLMSGQRLNIGEKAELLFRAWNAWRKDETVKTIALQGGELPLLEA